MHLTIFMPAYNEGRVIGSVLESLPKKIAGIDKISVIVVDDGSSDNTSEIARKHGAQVIRHPLNRGVGLATITGIRAARQVGSDMLVMLDSDGQHDPDDLARVLKPILDREADIVVGTRLINPKGMPLIRRFGNKTMNFFLRIFSGVYTTDSQSGFRAFTRQALDSLRLTTSGYEVHTEILVAAKHANLRLAEVPIRVIYTDYSKMKGQTLTNAINVVFRLLVKTIMG